MNLTDPDERAIASAEYVIGLLQGDDLQSFEAQLQQDSELATGVATWRDRLLPLTVKATAITPSEDLWNRISLFLPGNEPETVLDGRTFTAPRVVAKRQWWNSLGLWRTVSALALTATVVMGVYISQRPPEVRVYLAVLKSPAQQTGWLVHSGTAGAVRLVPLDPGATVPVGKSLQLWTQPSGVTAPIPIALIDPGTAFEISAERLPGFGDEQLFAISLEPIGGSPTGLPTGPILFAGSTKAL